MTRKSAKSGEQNRIGAVVELAIRKRLEEPPVKVRPKPTIEELEKILNSESDAKINILPDGRLETPEPTFCKDLAKAALSAIYADGWKIVRQDDQDAFRQAGA